MVNVRNFWTSYAIIAALLESRSMIPDVWGWVPLEAIEKFKDLEVLFYDKNPERAKSDGGVSGIPNIDRIVSRLKVIADSLPDICGPKKLINFEKIRRQYEAFRLMEVYQTTPFTDEYSGSCGGYLYHTEIWTTEKLAQVAAEIPPINPPDILPEIDDMHGVRYDRAGSIDGDFGGFLVSCSAQVFFFGILKFIVCFFFPGGCCY